VRVIVKRRGAPAGASLMESMPIFASDRGLLDAMGQDQQSNKGNAESCD